MDALDSGQVRVCSYENGAWIVHEDVKRAILLYFKESSCQELGAGAYDKVPSKFASWSEERFREAGLRVAPQAFVRHGSFLGRDVVLMPGCFINVGAFVGEKTMVDSLVTVGSCAQIGRGCHIGSGATLGGVLEPVAARPVILEDRVFVGANVVVAEGVVVREGAILATGVRLTASTWIIDRATGRRWKGEIPAGAVVVPGTYADSRVPGLSIQCAVVDRIQTDAKPVINEVLRSAPEGTASEER